MRPTAQGHVAEQLHIRGVVQGVGFRPFVYRVAHRLGLAGWVRNAETGVAIHLEGPAAQVAAFRQALVEEHPPAAQLAEVVATVVPVEGLAAFAIHHSTRTAAPTVRIAPDLSLCADCWAELRDPTDRRQGYPYLNCTNCGPRYSIITALPYDRPHTTMAAWPMCSACDAEYHDPLDRRFHAQPTACPTCGPHYALRTPTQVLAHGAEALAHAVSRLQDGQILAVKGLGGYHLVCDAQNEEAVVALRARKFRKEKPFALMVPDVETAQRLVTLSKAEAEVLTSVARPIVLLPRRTDTEAQVLPDAIAPGNPELGLMLPYTPLHVLLFDLGAPLVLVMTSANRSNEPIAYRDADALARLDGLADAFLIGERPIARRIDDAVVRVGPTGPMLLRRARGYAPGVVTRLQADRPVLAVGADLKNSLTLVVQGEAMVSQYIGDLDQYDVHAAFEQTIEDLTMMYALPMDEVLVVHDAHPQYRSTQHALDLPGEHVAVQHHRAHIASVLAERQAWDHPAVGLAFDGTGYGDDGTIWGGEVFAGSLRTGLERVAHLHPAVLPGGDAAAQVPVQAAAGFLAALDEVPDLSAAPFHFPDRFRMAQQLVQRGVRTYATTSMGRLFDTVAALLGFTRPMSFEGQAAIWLEHLARTVTPVAPYPMPELDYRPLLRALLADRLRGRPVAEMARAFHAGLADAIIRLGCHWGAAYDTDVLVVSGGVFQNRLLLELLAERLASASLRLWTNQHVPANDGGISFGQAALAVAAV